MHLMRCLIFFTARYQLILLPKHLPGRENLAADHLSRDALSSFGPTGEGRANPNARKPDGSSCATTARLDIGKLERCAAFFFSHGLASSSQKTYRSGENQYIKYCSSDGAAPLPVSEQLLCKFGSYLADKIVRGEVPPNKIGLTRPFPLSSYASSRVHYERNQEGAISKSSWGEGKIVNHPGCYEDDEEDVGTYGVPSRY